MVSACKGVQCGTESYLAVIRKPRRRRNVTTSKCGAGNKNKAGKKGGEAYRLPLGAPVMNSRYQGRSSMKVVEAQNAFEAGFQLACSSGEKGS